MYGASEVMARLFTIIPDVADSDTSVLITGETGSGKDLVARALHNRSRRHRRGPLIAVNCAGVPDALFESTFFGHVRGAFTGASADAPGLLVQSTGATLLLDEV